MTPLDLAPYLLTPGHIVITRKVESERSRKASAKRRVAELRAAREVFA